MLNINKMTAKWKDIANTTLQVKTQGFSFVIKHKEQKDNQYIIDGRADTYSDFKELYQKTLKQYKPLYCTKDESPANENNA